MKDKDIQTEIIKFNAHNKRNLKRKNRKYIPWLSNTKKKYYGYQKVMVPRNCNLYKKDYFDNFIEFLDEILTFSIKNKIMLNFGSTDHIKIPAALLLFQRIEFINKESDYHEVNIDISSCNSQVEHLIRIMGIQAISKNKYLKPNDSHSKTLPVVISDFWNHDDITDHVLKVALNNDFTPETEWLVSNAIQETINNITQHAYSTEKIKKKWWMTCHIIDNQLFLAIYDNGYGIPATILNTEWVKDIISKMQTKIEDKLKSDAKKIEFAMNAGSSQFKTHTHRGQGTKSIKDLVYSTPNGRLWVFSNKGLYKYSNERKEIKLTNFKKSVKGTLIQWNVDLNQSMKSLN